MSRDRSGYNPRMSRTTNQTLLALVVGTLLATDGSPHDTWLLPRAAAPSPSRVVTVDLTSGMNFPQPEIPVQPDRLVKAKMRLRGKVTDVTDFQLAERSLLLRATATESGLAAIWVQSKLRSIELKPDEVLEYLDEIGASADVRKAWREAPEPKRWRESYSKGAKVYIRSGPDDEQKAWAEPVGLPLEILPETDPTRLRVGSELSVRVLRNGATAKGFSLGLVGEGETSATAYVTDEQGRARLRLPRAGRWLVRGTDLRRSSATDTDWESCFTTLTLEVQ